ncbi:TIGR03086 family metal-binding protein [Luteimicrobium sp. NPDC057192]|uniref:TIGR03086 family metal-binding protein n=1 Tax=Luteimicrobium sp. NPDC057192 TaxID=3346042 RepID=UPI0036360D98
MEGSVAVVERVAPSDLARPTPCAGWTLADLLAHMVVQHDGFAAAARGEVTELADWEPRPVGDDVVAVYRTAAAGVVDAFAACDTDAELWLPEVRGGVGIPAQTALGFHLVDYVVHAWDVAASLGAADAFAPDDDVLAQALDVSRQVPDGEARTVPGAAFAPALAGDGGGALAETLRLLGRDPAWAPDRG